MDLAHLIGLNSTIKLSTLIHTLAVEVQQRPGIVSRGRENTTTSECFGKWRTQEKGAGTY